jgi:hypothetical protein
LPEAAVTDESKPPSRPRRRYLRFSVRRLIVLVLVIAAWLGWIVHCHRVQRDAVSVIKKSGGSVYYDWEVKDSIISRRPHPWAPQWLVNQVGIDYLGNAVHVIAQTRKIDDAIWVPVGRLSRLERLDLSNSAVTDAGLVHLEGLTHLHTLELVGTDVGDAGLANLKGLTRLRILRLDQTRVGDAGLAHLKGLTGLERLSVSYTQVSNSGLRHLKGLTGLRSLDLRNTQVTDAGVREFQQSMWKVGIRE